MIAQVIIENGVKKIIPLTADAGAGIPVGTIIPMYKKSSPSGYLYCDGSTFDQTKYPLLYAYLGSNVLPDYREFALVGAEENTTSSNIATHDVYTQGQEKDDQIQNHIHAVRGTYNTSGETARLPYMVPGQNNYNSNSTVEKSARSGTVTRGKRKAVYFYIKATSGLSENAQDNVINTLNEQRSYSTEEHLTGRKWIDGKPIYAKTIDCGALPNNTSKSVAHNITNIDQVILMQGVSTAHTNGNTIPLPFTDVSRPANGLQLYYTTSDIVLQTGGDRSIYTKTYVTLEYTKTTD